MLLDGNLPSNNYVQLPNPSSLVKGLGLNGRYVYIQLKQASSTLPMIHHFDLQMADRAQGIRISVSNLIKKISVQNNYVIQVPLTMDLNRWTVAVLDVYNILQLSGLLPPTYMIGGSYQIKQIILCASCSVCGVFTSDNLYDFVTLPPEMRFKSQYEISRWPE